MPDSSIEPAYILEAVGVRRTFGELVALDDVSIAVRPVEFLTLLGPSGSGKTTLLNIIAGLETPSEIRALRIAGEDVRDRPAHRRNVTTVFQHYALFPHISVGENVEYGLRVRGVSTSERRKAAMALLELVRLPHAYERRIHQLSGGERQRVALARALAPQPAILLLDEPLGALDEKLRLDMQVELHDLQRRLGMTFVYVTHSLVEALTMSDRIVLMTEGRIVQEGAPRDLFERPTNRFTAAFMGVENIFDGVLEVADRDEAALRVGNKLVRGRWRGRQNPTPGSPVSAAVRAEKVHIGASPPAEAAYRNAVASKAVDVVYKGKYVDQIVDSPLGRIRARVWDAQLEASRPEWAWWREEDCAIVPLD
jgi:ABC-type Fe3+/spermidine/putrescine transport system ATPase subunit